jgi:hypothetical protein
MSLTELHDRLDERFRLLTGAERLLLGRLGSWLVPMTIVPARQ